MFVAAEQLLTNVARAFMLRNGQLQVHDAQAKRAALLTHDAARCTCIEFNMTPFVPPYIGLTPRQNVRHCTHTLAWQGYTRILRRHYQVLRGNAPGNLAAADRWKLGEHHPANTLAYILFADWLSSTPMLAQSKALLAKEQPQYRHPNAARRAAALATITQEIQTYEDFAQH